MVLLPSLISTCDRSVIYYELTTCLTAELSRCIVVTVKQTRGTDTRDIGFPETSLKSVDDL